MLYPNPEAFDYFPFCQYGSGEHSSSSRKLLGTVLLTSQAHDGTLLQIRHFVLDVSNQWVILSNVTSLSIIMKPDDNFVLVPDASGGTLRFNFIYHEFHLHITFYLFANTTVIASSPSTQKD